jgi:hypothetical protein
MMTILSTAYFPPISWMALLLQSASSQVDLFETYQKQSYRNRCRLGTANGVMSLSVPVKKPNGNQTISRDVLIEYKQNWPLVHWRSIQAAYQSSPFFLYYQDEIESVFLQKYDSLASMNRYIVEEIAGLIGFQAALSNTNDFILPDTLEHDFRFKIHPKKPMVFSFEKYCQVFEHKYPFMEDLSILDLLFNLGPESLYYLENISLK